MPLSQLIANWRDTAKLQEADTPLVRWSVFAIGLLVLWFWLVEPLQQWRLSLEKQISQNARQAVRLVSLKEQAEHWAAAEQQAITALEEEMNSLFLQASDTAAQAKMQELLQKTCRTRNVTIVSQKLLPAEPEAIIGRKLAIAMDLRGELADILAILDDLSTARRLVTIERWILKRDKRGAFAQIVIAGFRGVAGDSPDEG